MSFKRKIVFWTFLLCSLGCTLVCFSQEIDNDNEVEVSLRMIGHQVLLNSKDSTSRVLPIVKEDNRYKIQFESAFEFEPEQLVATVDKVVKETNLASSYMVEVEKCDTKEIVYSFKVNYLEQSEIIPCTGRIQPKSCYSLLVELIDTKEEAVANESSSKTNYMIIAALLILLVVAFLIWRKKNKSKTKADPNLIRLGSYLFDKKNTELIIEEQRIELTSKEADLLLLLYNTVNSTVERDVILNTVWGDEGNYVGRTLDVFISKLRKKLEFDSQVKIVNVRGVGYKLVMDV